MRITFYLMKFMTILYFNSPSYLQLITNIFQDLAPHFPISIFFFAIFKSNKICFLNFNFIILNIVVTDILCAVIHTEKFSLETLKTKVPKPLTGCSIKYPLKTPIDTLLKYRLVQQNSTNVSSQKILHNVLN